MEGGWVLWRPRDAVVRGKRYWECYLADDRSENFSLRCALLFTTQEGADNESLRLQKSTKQVWLLRWVSEGECLNIRKHKLRTRSWELFGIRYNTPLAVLADRYEEEGMLEEAELLRRK